MTKEDLAFEESFADTRTGDLELLEVPLTNRTLIFSGVAIFLFGFLVFGRIFVLATRSDEYRESAYVNLREREELAAPRGIVYDRNNIVLAENIPSFFVFLNVKEFLRDQSEAEKALNALKEVIGMSSADVWERIRETDFGKRSPKILLAGDITQSQLIQFKSRNLESVGLSEGFRRSYPQGPLFSSIVGYTGLVNAEDLENDPTLNIQTTIGRAGLEAFYDNRLRGKEGAVSRFRNAEGEAIGEPETVPPKIGEALKTTIDGEFQAYFHARFAEGLRALGRSVGVGIAMNPKNGEILALFNFPAFDNNIFVAPGYNEEKKKVLASPLKPLVNRAVSGYYTPGSTIKPLVAVGALHEGVITPEKTIFSPGYLDVPNPYEPGESTRFLDWRYQGSVNMRAALAQSSNVYFYTVGGGFENIKGLGITGLTKWWKQFRLGEPTGIDLVGEAAGTLPTPEKKEKTTGRAWLLGDTFNVSIGQGDLLLTPIQLINYISAIASGGKLFQPFIVHDDGDPRLLTDLSSLEPELKEVEAGMIAAASSPQGTAYLLHDLPFKVAAKTGTAQIMNNAEQNAFFVGYIPAQADASSGTQAAQSHIAILILIENSREGSLNTVPIAKDVLNWYYRNRILE